MQQTFSMEPEPRVSLLRAGGDLEVRGWDRREISLDWDAHEGDVRQEGNTLILLSCAGDIRLRVPYDTEMCIEDLAGDVFAQDVRRAELKNVQGDVALENVGVALSLEDGGEAISLTDLGGDLRVRRASSLRVYHRVEGNADVQEVAIVEIDAVGADLQIGRAERTAVGNVGGNLEGRDLSGVLRCGNVGGDCALSSSPQAEIDLGNIGGGLEIAGALLVHLGNVGGDTTIRDVQSSVSIGNIGGNINLAGMGGDLKAGRIGADAMLHGLGGSVYVGGIGGDLDLHAAFAPSSRAQLHIGGDASVALPDAASLTLLATVGGSIGGTALSTGSGGSLVRLVYGEGSAHVSLSVGGDLNLSGGGTPQVSSAGLPWWEFGQEMAQMGQEMARMGQELGEEFRKTFRDLGWSGVTWTDEVGRRVEEQVKRAREKIEQNARKAEERARRAGERARQRAERSKVRMHINEREWQMSPARLDDLVSRARQAAMEGVAGAMEAVERAVNNLRVPYPPYPPRPASRPAPFAPPASPTGARGPEPGSFPPSAVQPTPWSATRSEGEPAEAAHLEQERETILRMIAEGRITPEEGDMLLEGLGS
jgi:vacuolar-type H+-ATPase subunit H